MRIIGGEFRGRKLVSPSGKNIRPTSDRMRETMFNILEHSSRGLEGANILDVFAGTGALGLEALSRRAAHVSFFDRDRAALQLVKKNIALLNAENRTTVKFITAPNLPPTRRAYDFIFLDPPYDLHIINGTLDALNKNKYLADDCMIIAEYASDNIIEFPDYLEISKEKTYGEARFTFLRKIS